MQKLQIDWSICTIILNEYDFNVSIIMLIIYIKITGYSEL